MNPAALKEIIRRKTRLLAGTARPGRVTRLVPNRKGGFVRRLIGPEACRKAQAADRVANWVAQK